MGLSVAHVKPDGHQCDVYIQGDSMNELSDDHAHAWRKLAEAAVVGLISSPMLKDQSYVALDAEGRPLGAVASMDALKTARFFRKLTYVGGGGMRV